MLDPSHFYSYIMEKKVKEISEIQRKRLREWGKKGGRKKISSPKCVHFSFRLTLNDAREFRQILNKSGLSAGEYIKQRIIKGDAFYQTKRKQEGIILLIQELRRVGINVNQIAHEMNLYHKPVPGSLETLFELQKEIKNINTLLNELR